MISPSLVVNTAPAAPSAGAADAQTATTPGFGLALAAAQAGGTAGAAPAAPMADAPPTVAADAASLSDAAGLLASAVVPQVAICADDAVASQRSAEVRLDPAEDTEVVAAEGAASILAQMLAGSSLAAPAPDPAVAAGAPLPGLQAASLPVARAPTKALVASDHADDSGAPEAGPASMQAGKARTDDPLDPAVLAAAAPTDLLERVETAALFGKVAENATTSASSSTPQSPGAQAVHTVATALRDAAAPPAPPANTAPHAALREPVGTARWADELGNRLVMMSVRGQQQGSLTLTPEHLGPVEVQISVNRDTANVWFGAQHADTRAALLDAMPRLRELLASSGLSLGQSGVSEQAPREGFASGSGAAPGVGPAEATAVVETSAPAWRVWKPGLVDTYA